LHVSLRRSSSCLTNKFKLNYLYSNPTSYFRVSNNKLNLTSLLSTISNMSTTNKKLNRLANEKSPYLLVGI
jgi:hypothetical protein